MARVSWRVSPYLACHLPSRLKQEPALIQELIRLVRQNPEPAHMIPVGIRYLVTQECVAADGPELAQEMMIRLSIYECDFILPSKIAVDDE